MKVRKIPYETLGVPRDQIIELYQQMLAAKQIGSPEFEGEIFRNFLPSFGFSSEPKNGWANLAYELRLIELSLDDRPKAETAGRAELAKQCKKLAMDAERLEKQCHELSRSVDFSIAMFLSNSKMADELSALSRLKFQLENTRNVLTKSPQSPKWRQKQIRNLRIELACKLAVLFEAEFDFAARPVGGSATLPLEETNEWTCFYQAVAAAFWHEVVTPDRQAILWEAAATLE